MKLSLRMGTTLVPCYTFGNTRVFRSWNDSYGILRLEKPGLKPQQTEP